jgi:hypothetical protein
MNSAMSMVKKLTDEEWKDEKEWLKVIYTRVHMYIYIYIVVSR